jgi:hypothetical protein
MQITICWISRRSSPRRHASQGDRSSLWRDGARGRGVVRGEARRGTKEFTFKASGRKVRSTSAATCVDGRSGPPRHRRHEIASGTDMRGRWPGDGRDASLSPTRTARSSEVTMPYEVKFELERRCSISRTGRDDHRRVQRRRRRGVVCVGSTSCGTGPKQGCSWSSGCRYR